MVSGWATAAIGVAALIVGGLLGYLRDRWFLDHRLRREHEQQERERLRELISQYQGRVLEAALDWDRRMVQIYDGKYADLDPPDDERLYPEQYYYQSVVFRFLQLSAIARRFELEAFYIKAAIALDEDFDLLRYAKSFLWVMIHAEITPDDGQPGVDHFRSDAFRPLLDSCYAEPKGSDGQPILPETRSRDGDLIFDLRRCLALFARARGLGYETEVHELLEFFDGVCPDDYVREEESDVIVRQRRRWDRLIALHLLVLAFIGKCGYDWDAKDLQQRVDQAVRMLLHPENLRLQYAEWLPRLGLVEQAEIRRIQVALEAVAHPEENDDERARRVLAEVASASRHPVEAR